MSLPPLSNPGKEIKEWGMRERGVTVLIFLAIPFILIPHLLLYSIFPNPYVRVSVLAVLALGGVLYFFAHDLAATFFP